MLSVFKNLLQNSVLHGQASSVKVKVKALDSSRLSLDVEDNGLGFKGEDKKLGSELLKSQDSRSNGIGLYITKRLVEKMNGRIFLNLKETTDLKATSPLEGN